MSTMSWENLLRPYRRMKNGQVEEDKNNGRSPFEQDNDKIIFSSAFRRLARKSQVHPLIDNDYIHNRLIHSLEVSSVGRTLGTMVGYKIRNKLPDQVRSPQYMGEIVQAACLAHDIGNPPFGHAGEEAIRSWFEKIEGDNIFKKMTSRQKMDLKYYDGNAQSFRVVSQLQYDTFEGGMRLTYPTQCSMLKYPWTSLKAEQKNKRKLSCFETEIEIMNDIASKLNIIRKDSEELCRHPLVYLVEAADDICYLLLDLEDATELRMLTLEYLINKLFDEYHSGDPKYDENKKKQITDRRKLAFIRGITIKKLIDAVITSFITNYDLIMKGQYQKSLLDECEPKSKKLIIEASKICNDCVYNHPRKIELEIGSYTTIGKMLESFCEAAFELYSNDGNRELSFKTKRILDLLPRSKLNHTTPLYHSIIRFLDYISGMTDYYATHISQQMTGKGGSDITR